jgi:hypothetical protein
MPAPPPSLSSLTHVTIATLVLDRSFDTYLIT